MALTSVQAPFFLKSIFRHQKEEKNLNMTGADICDVVQKPSKASPRQSVHGVQLEGADCGQDLAPAVPPAQT